ncbi:MAG: hypothetical protein KatS3mg110_0683 [Pirellulaceae bacterium]|nr:MAG: hypothetical protein KatS3mg110_0683 [Pirellulaceae bacterium]
MSCRHITRLAGSGRRCKFGLWAGVVGMALWSADAAVGQLPPTGLATGARTTAIDQPLEAVRPVYTLVVPDKSKLLLSESRRFW